MTKEQTKAINEQRKRVEEAVEQEFSRLESEGMIMFIAASMIRDALGKSLIMKAGRSTVVGMSSAFLGLGALVI